jgi:SNF2 family DNA or RNA helicase
MLRRLKADVARELPQRTEVRVDVELTPEKRRRYDQLRRSVFADLHQPGGAGAREGQRRFQILAALTRLAARL